MIHDICADKSTTQTCKVWVGKIEVNKLRLRASKLNKEKIKKSCVISKTRNSTEKSEWRCSPSRIRPRWARACRPGRPRWWWTGFHSTICRIKVEVIFWLTRARYKIVGRDVKNSTIWNEFKMWCSCVWLWTISKIPKILHNYQNSSFKNNT